MTTMNKARALTMNDAALLLCAGSTVACVRLALWLVPFGMVRRMTAWLGRRRNANGENLSARQICRAVMIASRFVPRATCLTQALAAEALLSRRGFTGTLCLGVKRDSVGFGAHAWLEDE